MTDRPDVTPVDFYRRLPTTGEPELIVSLVGTRARVLDLACAAGRIAIPLATLGCSVTGVDLDPAMIAALPPEVHGVVADATTARLDRRFDAVLLLSHLVNDPVAGPAFVRTAAAHLVPAGLVIGETYPPGADPTQGVGRTTRMGAAHVTLLRASRAADLLEAEVRYGVDGRTWTEAFTARLLDEEQLRRVLREAGLGWGGWLERPGWFTCRAA